VYIIVQLIYKLLLLDFGEFIPRRVETRLKIYDKTEKVHSKYDDIFSKYEYDTQFAT